MIVRNKPSAWQLFYVTSGSIVTEILPQILMAMAVAFAVVYLEKVVGVHFSHVPIIAFSVFGIALSLFLGFRNNASYERWWEARIHWGQMIYEIRSMARSTSTLIAYDHPERKPFLYDSVAFSHFLRGGLRREDCSADAARFVGEDVAARAKSMNSPCDFFLRQMGDRVERLKDEGSIDSIGLQILDTHLTNFSSIQAACERMDNTPIPFAYSLLIHRTAYLYCFLLPLGLVGTVEWLTPLFTGLLAYVFFGLDAVSEQLETPFDRVPNGLPLDSLCRTIEISVAEALREPAPERLQPVDHVLS